MKFLYQYRTSDNQAHNGTIDAASKDAAYAALRSRGIRPSRMEEAPGLLNKLLGKGKRWIAIGVLCSLCAALCLLLAKTRRDGGAGARGTVPVDRHQIYGDPGLMDAMEREEYASVFSDAGDRYLARFAQPGAIVRFTNRTWRADMAKALEATPAAPLEVLPGDVREVRELKQIVLGMRKELKAYLANGIGTCARYVKRVEERQVREAQIYYQAKNELSKERDPEVFERRNASLRRLGLRTIPAPEPE